MRRFTLVAAALFLSACGSPAPDGVAAARKVVIVAADAEPGSVAESNWRRFVENVGVWAPEFSVDLRTGASAGVPATRVADVQAGRIQIALLPDEAAALVVPEMAVLAAPGLFTAREEADHVLDTAALDAMHPLFSAQGLRLLDWAEDDWADPLTRDRYRVSVIVANKDWYERQTPHDRDVFTQAYGSAGQARADSRAAAPAIPAEVPTPPAGVAEPGDGPAAAHASIIDTAGGQARQIYDLVQQARRAHAASQPR